MGWFAYLVPVSLFVYWPEAHRPGPRNALWLRFGIAGALVVLAAGLAQFYPPARAQLPTQAPLIAAGDGRPNGRIELIDAGQVLALSVQGQQSRIALPPAQAKAEDHNGVPARAWHLTVSGSPAKAPATLTLDQVLDLNGGRAPIGLNFHLHPGPYTAQWNETRRTDIWTAGGLLLDAAQSTTIIVNLSGSGLFAPLTLVLSGGSNNWQVSSAYATAVQSAFGHLAAARQERAFWALQLPALLAFIALILALTAALKGRNLGRRGAVRPSHVRAPSPSEGKPHAAE
jgi:high-affinity iron transporter